MSEKETEKLYDTLYFIVNEKDGILAEYQKQLYEAAICGIDRVRFVVQPDLERKSNRLNDMQIKLRLTCEVFHLEVIEPGYIDDEMWMANSSLVFKTEQDGSLSKTHCDFDVFKETNEPVISKNDIKTFIKKSTINWKTVLVGTNGEIRK